MEMRLTGDLGKSGDYDDGASGSVSGDHVDTSASCRHDDDSGRHAFDGGGNGGDGHRHRRVSRIRSFLEGEIR